MKDFKKMKVGDIVTEDFRAAQVFKNEGIDFCCGGNITLQEIASEKKLNVEEIEYKLNNLESIPANNQLNFKEWDLGFLSDYVVNQYHNKVNEVLPTIMLYLNKIVSVHGDNHPELSEVLDLFTIVNNEMPEHQRREEEKLFPAIKEVLKSNSVDAKKMIHSELTDLEDDHDFIGGTMDKINEITGRYALPEDACNTYRITFKMLEEFEDALHEHVHIENNILFPKSLTLVGL